MCFMTLLPNTLIFLLKKCLSHFFQQKNIGIFQILILETFNETLTSSVVSFEQLGPDWGLHVKSSLFSVEDLNDKCFSVIEI